MKDVEGGCRVPIWLGTSGGAGSGTPEGSHAPDGGRLADDDEDVTNILDRTEGGYEWCVKGR